MNFKELFNKAIQLHLSGNIPEALASYGQVLELNPTFVDALNNQGICLQALNRHDEALNNYAQALELKPDYVDAHYNQGICLKALNRHDEALASYAQALKLQPAHAEAHFNNQGNSLQALNRHDEALASYAQALKLQPDYADAYWNLSLLQLLQGNYKEGWQNYEWRKKIAKKTKNGYSSLPQQQAWLGMQDLKDKNILISKEQGLGDYIQFCRYLPMIQELGGKIILDTPKSLRPLIDTLGIDKTYTDELEKVQFQYHCAIMSLPLAFKTKLGTIPNQGTYLFTPDDKKKYWQEKLGKKTTPRIGLVWSGNESHVNDLNRSLSLEQLKPWLDLPYEFHSLQIDYRKHDIKLLPTFPNLYCHEKDIEDFTDTAGLIESMDLIISVDTSVAHLAGAIGKKILILLPYASDFRWLVGRPDSPWYPTARLFRQPAIDNWESVVKEIKQLLLHL